MLSQYPIYVQRKKNYLFVFYILIHFLFVFYYRKHSLFDNFSKLFVSFFRIEAEQTQLSTHLPICYNLVLETTGVFIYKAGDNIIL